MKKVYLAGLAALFTAAITISAPVSARPAVGPSTAVELDKSVDLVKGKKKKAKAKAKKSKAGKCGTYNYWSKKAKKCVDARSAKK